LYHLPYLFQKGGSVLVVIVIVLEKLIGWLLSSRSEYVLTTNSISLYPVRELIRFNNSLVSHFVLNFYFARKIETMNVKGKKFTHWRYIYIYIYICMCIYLKMGFVSSCTCSNRDKTQLHIPELIRRQWLPGMSRYKWSNMSHVTNWKLRIKVKYFRV